MDCILWASGISFANCFKRSKEPCATSRSPVAIKPAEVLPPVQANDTGTVPTKLSQMSHCAYLLESDTTAR